DHSIAGTKSLAVTVASASRSAFVRTGDRRYSQRPAEELTAPGSRLEAVTRPADRDEMTWFLGVSFEALAEPAQKMVDRSRLRQEVEAPDVLKQGITSDDRALGRDQLGSQLEFKRRERDPTRRAQDSEPVDIERPQIIGLDDLEGLLAASE